MSSPVVAAAPSSKIKISSKSKTKNISARIGTDPTSGSKRRKPEPPTKSKGNDDFTAGLKSKKLTEDERTNKRAKLLGPSKTEGTRPKDVVDRLGNAKRAARPEQKRRGPLPPSPSPSLPSEPEPSRSEPEEGKPEAPREEGVSGSEAEGVHLYGFSTDEEDSSGDDLDGVDEGADVDVGSLPTISRDDATVKRKLENAELQPVRVVVAAFPFVRGRTY